MMVCCFIFFCCYAQTDTTKKDISVSRVVFKTPSKSAYATTKPLTPYQYHAPTNQLMFWPNYPLSATEIEAKRRLESKSFGLQVTESIAKQVVTSLIKGTRKTPDASLPRF
jgi:hypothetical protein